MNQPNVVIRSARAEDIPEVMNKIRELAIFEQMEHQCKMTAETLLKDGGFLSDKDHKRYELLVAEVTVDGKPKMVGYAIWIYPWTSWEGKIGFVEDIYVDENYRKMGIARRFFNLVAKEVIKNKGAYLKLNVFGWNKNAINVYNKLGGRDLTIEKDKHVYRFDQEALEKLAKEAEEI